MSKTEPMFDDEEELIVDQDQPPQLVDELTKIASEFMNKHFNRINWSHRIPRQPIEIAKWWATIDKPPHPFDNCKKKTNSKTQKSSWHCPYIELATFRLGVFLHQDPEFQDVIIDANMNGCFWVGHDIEDFKNTINEHMKMLDVGVAEYRKQVMETLGSLKFKRVAA